MPWKIVSRSHLRLVALIQPVGERVAARSAGLATGLALAVRLAGSAEAPRSRVGPRDPFCEAVRKDLGCP
jgi:hypothetical protein